MNYEKLIEELRALFPTPPIYSRTRVGDPYEWVLQRGIESGRDEVISYLENLLGVKPLPLEDLPYVRPSENRCSADEYGRSTAAPGSQPGPDFI